MPCCADPSVWSLCRAVLCHAVSTQRPDQGQAGLKAQGTKEAQGDGRWPEAQERQVCGVGCCCAARSLASGTCALRTSPHSAGLWHDSPAAARSLATTTTNSKQPTAAPDTPCRHDGKPKPEYYPKEEAPKRTLRCCCPAAAVQLPCALHHLGVLAADAAEQPQACSLQFVDVPAATARGAKLGAGLAAATCGLATCL